VTENPIRHNKPQAIIDTLKVIVDAVCQGDSGQIIKAGIYKHKNVLGIELYLRDKYVGRIIGMQKKIDGIPIGIQAPMKDAILKILNTIGYFSGINSVDLWVASLDKYSSEQKEVVVNEQQSEKQPA
jgi:hypothetical protein